MSRSRRVWVWLAGGAGILLALLLILALLLPFLIDQEAVRGRIMADLSRRVDGRVETQSVSLWFLPRPHLTLYQAEISIPGTAHIQAESLTAYPSLLPLLRGRVQVRKIAADAPVISVEIPEAEKVEEPRVLTPGGARDQVRSLLDSLAENMAGLTAEVSRGEVVLLREGEPVVHFRDLEGEIQFPPQLLEVSLSGSSDVGDLITLDGWVDSRDLRAEGRIRLSGFQPQKAAAPFSLSPPQELEDSTVTADLTFQSIDPEVFQVTIHQLALSREKGRDPSPLEAQGQLIWEGDHLVVAGLEGSMGESSFSNLTGRIAWGENREIQIDSLSARLLLDELHPWLLSFEALKGPMEDLESAAGVIVLRTLELKGPLDHPERWTFQGEGEVEDLSIDFEGLPAPLSVSRGTFQGDRMDSSPEEPPETFRDPLRVSISGVAGSLGKSTFSQVSARLEPDGQQLIVDSAAGRVDLGETVSWLRVLEGLEHLFENVTSLEGVFLLDRFSSKGPLLEPAQWDFQAEGTVEDLRVESPLLPGPFSTSGGRITVDRERIRFAEWSAVLLDSAIRVSGDLSHYIEAPRRVDVRLAGNLSPQAVQWTAERLEAPEGIRFNRAVRMEDAALVWEEGKETLFSGRIHVEEGPEIAIDLQSTEEALSIRQARIVDEDSDLTLSLRLQEEALDFTFQGNLSRATVDRVLEENPYLEGRIEGDLEARILIDRPAQSTAQGRLVIEGFSTQRPPIQLEQAVLRAVGNRVEVESSRLLWAEEKRGSLTGAIDFSEDAFQVDMDLAIGGLEWEELERLMAGPENGAEEDEGNGTPLGLPLRGEIRARPDYFRYGGYTWKPVQGRIAFLEGRTEIRIDEANLCGIQTPGSIHFTPHGIHLTFQPAAGDQPLSDTLGCLWEEGDLMVGDFDLEGKITSTGEGADLVDAIQGKLKFHSENGRIFRFGLLSRIFAVVNITEILRGKTPDLVGEGLAFDSLVAEVNLEGSSLVLEEVVLTGPSMNIFTIGSLDLQESTLDLTVTVAPFRTVDAIIGRIPLIGDILEGTLISLPVRVTGDMANPTVNPISPGAVGDRMIRIMERTLTLPFRLIQPTLPGDGE